MNRRNAWVLLGGGVLLGATFVGCVIFTGSSSGYSSEPVAQCTGDAGCDASSVCGDDPSCSTLGCASAADCVGDAGQICCLRISATGAPSAGCQADPCVTTVQLCVRDSECGDASCTAQKCGPIGAGICGAPDICALLGDR
jgi:hypothetical protein